MKITSVVGAEGQITIPAALRRRYGPKGGGTVVFRVVKGRLVMEPDPLGTKADNQAKGEQQIPFGNDTKR